MSTENGVSRSFEIAWSSGISGCRMECNCGRTFFDDSSNDWDWEDGELESLRESALAQPDRVIGSTKGSSTSFVFEGVWYVDSCPCTEKLKRYEDFILRNAVQIAAYLNRNAEDEESHAKNSKVKVAP